MNWDAIGAVGEILGAIAVVITLGYLAIQLRLARVASEVESTYVSHESYSRWRIAIMQNPELPKTIAKANRGEELADEEEISISTLTQELFIGAVVSSATNKRLAIFYDVSVEIEYIVRILKANPGLAPYWHKHKTMFRPVNPDYVVAIDERIAEAEAK